MSSLSFTIGRDKNNNAPIHSSLISNLLILGSTYTGKTTLAIHIANELASTYSPNELKFILVNANPVALYPLHNLPHSIQPIIEKPESVSNMLSSLEETIQKRQRLLIDANCESVQEYNQKHPNKIPAIIIIIDETADIALQNKASTTQLAKLLQSDQQKYDIHFIIGATTSGANPERWIKPFLTKHRKLSIILLESFDKSVYDQLFSDLKNKLTFSGNIDRTGYYIEDFKKGTMKNFSFANIDPIE